MWLQWPPHGWRLASPIFLSFAFDSRRIRIFSLDPDNVRFGSNADIGLALVDIHFTKKTDIAERDRNAICKRDASAAEPQMSGTI